MLLWALVMGVFLSCKDGEIDLLTEQAKENPLKGKVQTLLTKNGNNKTSTEWLYDATTKALTGSKTIDSVAKTTTTETFKRDTEGKIQSIAIEKTNADGNKTQSEKVYTYNEKGQILTIKEALKDEILADEFIYNVDNQIVRYSRNSIKGGRMSNLQIIQYTWKQGNATNKTDRSLAGGYEEEDYQYGTSENLLAKFYKEELKLLGGYTPEFISQKAPTSSNRLFDGLRFKYESEVNQANKLISFKVLVNKNGIWENYIQTKILYHE